MALRFQSDYFDYQMKACIEELKEYLDVDIMTDDLLWENSEQFGKIVFEAICEQTGLDSVGVEEV